MRRIVLVAFLVMLSALAFMAARPLLAKKADWGGSIGAAPAIPLITREDCKHYTPLRQAFFGDLHVHTAFSWDGIGRGMRNTPDQAYLFAQGATLGLPPYDAQGNGLRSVTLDRPLDFAAVTDHAELFGEVALCVTPGASGYDLDMCKSFRGEKISTGIPRPFSRIVAIVMGKRSMSLCGNDGEHCRNAALDVWKQTQRAAEAAYDRSEDCAFTTFHGYEYSYAPMANRVHRNVIFRNELVPELPVSSADALEPEALWRRLQTLCLDAPGDCDVLAIPHNPNHASGLMFPLSDPALPIDKRREKAQLSARLEPLVEMMQIKGESECRNGLWGVSGAPDEFCDLEKWAPLEGEKDCAGGTGIGKSLGRGCVSRTDYARYAIAAGMQEEKELGVNPYRLGFIGSTDNHNAAPGSVDEWSFQGSTGLNDAELERRLKPPIQRNPGGLMGVWAEQNERDSLFDAMQRREVFATSGTRIKVRLFGGWRDFSDSGPAPQSWCVRPDAVEAAYSQGVPMGGKLPLKPDDAGTPYFAVQAQRDPGTSSHPGGLLQRIQVIKVQVLGNGDYKQQVFDVAGGSNEATVDTASCAPKGNGADNLCAVWQDPDFDANQSAAYYVRVLENPSCRWTTWTCLGLPENQWPAACLDPDETKLTQERAWSSPIWYDAPEFIRNGDL